MRRALFLTLAISALFPVVIAAERHAASNIMPDAPPDGANRPHLKARRRPTNATSKHRLKRARHENSAEQPMVREVDAEGMKKLLQRDPTQNPRPLLVNFWASWCGPCRDEFPDLVKIDAEYRSRGLEFIAISVDDVTEINKAVPQFLREMRAQMPAYLLNTPTPEAAISAVDPTWEGTLPATFLFDAHGQNVFKHMGRINPAELREALEKVMSDK